MSFLRLKTLEIGYSLPKNVVNKISAKSIRFFASGNNLFYISKFKLWDPELATSDGFKISVHAFFDVGGRSKFLI